jgi:hypothetical protein
MCFFAMIDQMDWTWVHVGLFFREHIDGVKEFMNFIQGKFSDDEELLCPCGRCLNQKYFVRLLCIATFYRMAWTIVILGGFIMDRGWM